MLPTKGGGSHRTTTAVNLSVVLSHLTMGNQSTMLLDFDQTKGDCHTMLGYIIASEMKLALARNLLDAQGRAQRLTILLDNTSQTEPMRDRLQTKLKAAGFDMEILTWQELSDFYNQVHGMFDMIFGFIFSIWSLFSGDRAPFN